MVDSSIVDLPPLFISSASFAGLKWDCCAVPPASGNISSMRPVSVGWDRD
jgi:hypothetical protein